MEVLLGLLIIVIKQCVGRSIMMLDGLWLFSTHTLHSFFSNTFIFIVSPTIGVHKPAVVQMNQQNVPN